MTARCSTLIICWWGVSRTLAAVTLVALFFTECVRYLIKVFFDQTGVEFYYLGTGGQQLVAGGPAGYSGGGGQFGFGDDVFFPPLPRAIAVAGGRDALGFGNSSLADVDGQFERHMQSLQYSQRHQFVRNQFRRFAASTWCCGILGPPFVVTLPSSHPFRRRRRPRGVIFLRCCRSPMRLPLGQQCRFAFDNDQSGSLARQACGGGL